MTVFQKSLHFSLPMGQVPANIMDPFFAQAGTYISPQQGTIVRAHPFIR